MPKALVYALGGGRGHATRCGVLARWFPAGWEVHTILPARLAEHFPGAFHHYVTPLDLRRQILSLLAQVQPDLLLVDTFPRGLLGELAALEFPCQAWLVARWMCLEYATRLEVMQALQRYQKVLQCELTPWETGLDLGPVVGPPAFSEVALHERAFRELASQESSSRKSAAQESAARESATQEFAARESSLEAPILWLGSGPVSWQRQMERFLRGQNVVQAAPDLGFLRRDVPKLLSQDRLVISAGGYNAYHQIVQAGTPVIFWPQARSYDEQSLRVRGRLGPAPRGWCRVVESFEELREALTAWEQHQPRGVEPLSLARPELFQQLLDR